MWSESTAVVFLPFCSSNKTAGQASNRSDCGYGRRSRSNDQFPRMEFCSETAAVASWNEQVEKGLSVCVVFVRDSLSE